jgi:hypothetical protein
MAQPIPELIQALLKRVTDWSLPDAALAESLNAATVPNPVPAAVVPVKPTLQQLLACIGDDARRAQVVQWTLFGRLFDAYQGNDLTTLQDLAAAALAADFATAGTLDRKALAG